MLRARPAVSRCWAWLRNNLRRRGAVGPGRVQLINNGPRFVLSAVKRRSGLGQRETFHKNPHASASLAIADPRRFDSATRRAALHRLCAKRHGARTLDADVWRANRVLWHALFEVDAGAPHPRAPAQKWDLDLNWWLRGVW